MLMLTSSGFAPAIQADPTKYEQIEGWPGVENRRPLAGTGRSCRATAGPVQSGKRTLRIDTTILMFNAQRGRKIAANVLKAFRAYVKYNIEAVWNSSTNDYISPSYKVTCVAKVTIVAANTGTLSNGELFIAVKRGGGRTFITQDRRAGVFYLNDERYAALESLVLKWNPDTPLSALAKSVFSNLTSDVPAHEFGHAMGLADRYAYLGYCVPRALADQPKLGDKPKPPEVIINRGHTIPLYVSSAYDAEYGQAFGWLFNLMSSQKRAFPGSPAGSGNWDGFDPSRSNGIKVQNTKKFSEHFSSATAPSGHPNLFITKKQLEIVEGNLGENIPGSGLIFLKEINRTIHDANEALREKKITTGHNFSYVFKGTFIGIATDPNGGQHVAHDDNYDISRNTSDKNNSPINDSLAFDDNMELRSHEMTASWIQGQSLIRAKGLIDAALNVNTHLFKYSASKIVGGELVPKDLAGLLDLEHLDRAVSIRRFVADYMQCAVDSDGSFRMETAVKPGDPPEKVPTLHRFIALQAMSEVRMVDDAFTPPTDFFAKPADLYPYVLPVSTTGLFIPYDFGLKSFRKGLTRFHPANVIPPAGNDYDIPVTDPHPLDPISTGEIIGSATGKAAMADIWNAGFEPGLPEPEPTYKGKPFLPYSATLCKNRIRLIALAQNGALSIAPINSHFDPRKYSLSRCFEICAVLYSGTGMKRYDKSADNYNTSGAYFGLSYRF